MGLLSLAIWVPIGFGALLLAMGREGQVAAVRWLALLGAFLGLLATLPLYEGFKLGTAAMQFVEKTIWIESFNVYYHLGLDGISFWFVPLTAFITLIVVIASWESVTERVSQYMGAFLILSGLMIGVFSALDGMLFYVFFEATLIPMYLIIGIWGGPNKIYAAFKFFLYTLLGSLLMLVALIYLYNQSAGRIREHVAGVDTCGAHVPRRLALSHQHRIFQCHSWVDMAGPQDFCRSFHVHLDSRHLPAFPV